jgi:hypothetical protein
MGDKRAKAQSMLSSNACRTVEKVRPSERFLADWELADKNKAAWSGMGTDLAAGLTAGLRVGRSDVEEKILNLKQNHRHNTRRILNQEKNTIADKIKDSICPIDSLKKGLGTRREAAWRRRRQRRKA